MPHNKLSPRVRLASRLYASGSVPTKIAAAQAAGLSPSYFSVVSSPANGREEVHTLMDEVDQQLSDQTVEMSSVLQTVGREAVRKIRNLMNATKNEAIALGAAKDLADRSPETSKVQKHQVESLSMSGHDARELAQALVLAAEARRAYSTQVGGDFIRVPIAEPFHHPSSQLTPSERSPYAEPRREDATTLCRSDEVDGAGAEGNSGDAEEYGREGRNSSASSTGTDALDPTATPAERGEVTDDVIEDI